MSEKGGQESDTIDHETSRSSIPKITFELHMENNIPFSVEDHGSIRRIKEKLRNKGKGLRIGDTVDWHRARLQLQ